MWKVPPMEGQVVRLDPTGQNYRSYNRSQSKGDPGIIVRVHNDSLRSIINVLTDKDRSVGLTIQWANGHVNSYSTKDALPVGNHFVDLKRMAGTYYTTISNQIALETHMMMYDDYPLSETNAEVRKALLANLLNLLGGYYDRHLCEDPVPFETVKANLERAIEKGETPVDLNDFFAKANQQWEDNVAAHTLRETLIAFPIDTEEPVFESTTQAEATMPEPPPNVRRTTETFEEYIARVARDGVEINQFDIEYATTLGNGPSNDTPQGEVVGTNPSPRPRTFSEVGGAVRGNTAPDLQHEQTHVEGVWRTRFRADTQGLQATTQDAHQADQDMHQATQDMLRMFANDDD